MAQQKQIRNEDKDFKVVDGQARKISWIVAIVIIILSIFIAIVCTVIYTKQPSLPVEYDYVIENWKQSPIIKLSPSNVGCEEYFTSYVFPGTVDGCDCTSSPTAAYGNQIFNYPCSSEHLSSSCKTINSTPTKDFSRWKLKDQTFQLCSIRAIGFDYTKSDCEKNGYKRCGVAEGDKINPNMFCIPSNVACPINSIVYGLNAPDLSYQSIINIGGLNIYISSENLNSQPIVYSRVSRGRGECKQYNSQHFVDTNIKEYELIRGKEDTCTLDQTDNRFKLLFQIDDKSYLEANNYLTQINQLPNYPLNQANANYYFLTRQYIPWNQLGTCRFTHMPYFIDLKSHTDKVSELWVGCIIVNWFVAVLYGFVASALRLKMNWKIKNWIIFPVGFLLLTQMIITIITFSYSVDVNKKIQDMSDAKCSDEYTNNLISGYSNDYNTSVLSFQIVLLVFVLILIIFTLFFMKTIFIIVRLAKESILPQTNKSTLRSGNNSNKNKNDAELLQERDQNLVGYDNTYGMNGNDGNTAYPQQEDGSDGTTNQQTQFHINVNGNQEIPYNQETVNIPLVIKVNDQSSPQKQKGVLKRGGEAQQPKYPNNTQSNYDNNSNMKITKFDDDHYNSQFEKNKELENLYAPASKTTATNVTAKNPSQGLLLDKNLANNNSNLNGNKNNQQGKQSPNKSLDSINDDKVKFNTSKDVRSKNDLQILSVNVPKSQNNLSKFEPSPTKGNVNFLIPEHNQNIQSLANMENLLDNNEWEFEIDDYVKKHREQQISSSRIGGGYEIGKPREKYLQHKFQRSTTRKLQSQHSIEVEHISPEKSKQLLSINQFNNQQTSNLISTNSLQPFQGNITEIDDSDRQNGEEAIQKLP